MEITLQMMQTKADETLQQIAAIKEQIARAKSAVHQTGDYSDADWFHSANRALRHKQAEHQMLLRGMAEKRAFDKKQAHKLSELQQKTYERSFIRAAKSLLSDEMYLAIIEEAKIHQAS